MSDNPKLAVGDRLWLVEKLIRGTRESEVVVTKAGRKWASIADAERPSYERPRIDLSDLVCDGAGYTSPGRCFRSQAEYEERLRLAETWDAFRQRISSLYRRPNHVTLADIEAASVSLRLSGPSA
ncbi:MULTISPECIES: beta barrel domain-containing protein [unclassified Sphingomonas]|uniref:beta barrel domain-containing protein n=1 Tax=unclassified Sphingomonas TaxID=196159 RepID=UPI000AF40B1E|nr:MULTISPECIES: hypothetical protein [unclassified Sphingomonas]